MKKQTMFAILIAMTLLLSTLAVVLAAPPDWAKGKKDKGKAPPIPPGLEKRQDEAEKLNAFGRNKDRFKPTVEELSDGCKMIRLKNKIIYKCEEPSSGLPGDIQ